MIHNNKIAIITGINGQDGSYLAENLLNHNYRVIGIKRRASNYNIGRLKHLNNKIEIIEGDVTDLSCLHFSLLKYRPTHLFNLAAQSHVATSFYQPKLTWDVTAQGCLNCLEAIRMVDKDIKFYQASSSEMYGDSINKVTMFQNEDTPFNPQSPYAIAKLAAYNATRLYRSSYGIFASNGILFNHESERRGDLFVTQKVIKYVADLVSNPDLLYSGEKLKLGNLNAYRDWGHAEDYVEAMRLILEHDVPDDFVIATAKTYSVRNLVEISFGMINLDYRDYIEIDDSLKRPSEVPYLCGDYSKAKEKLNWSPKIDFYQLIRRMLDNAISNNTRH